MLRSVASATSWMLAALLCFASLVAAAATAADADSIESSSPSDETALVEAQLVTRGPGGAPQGPHPVQREPLLRLSRSSERVLLAGRTVLGKADVVASAPSSTRQVAFYIDDREGKRKPLSVDKSAPFRLDFDTRSVSNGAHWLTAALTNSDGSVQRLHASFSVDNPPVPPPPPPAPPPDQQGKIRVEATFDRAPVGTLSAGTLRDQFETQGAHVPYAEGKDLKALSVVANPQGPGRVLKATLPGGQIGGVMNFPVNIIQDGPGYDEVNLSYRVMFGDGFSFTPYGGKLPGLAGGPSKGNLSKDFPAACKAATGDNGFSARGMWVSWKMESSKKPIMDQYVYHKNKVNRCGDDFPYKGPSGMTVLQANRWYHITHRVVMNDPGRRNGIVEAWMDGEKVLSVTNLEFRNDRSWGINVLYMAGFFGGSTDEWKHSRTETMYYDDFLVRAVR